MMRVNDGMPSAAGRALSVPLITAALIHAGLFLALSALLSLRAGGTAAAGGASEMVVLLGDGGMAGSTVENIPYGVETGKNSPDAASARGDAAEKLPAASESLPDSIPESAAPEPVQEAEPPAPPPVKMPERHPDKAPPAEPPEQPDATALSTPTARVKETVPEKKPARKPVRKPVKEAEKPVKTQRTETPAKPAPAETVTKAPQRTHAAEASSAAGRSTENARGAAGAAETKAGTARGEASGAAALPGAGEGLKKRSEGVGDASLVANGDGTYRATGKGSLRFTILRDAEPRYPRRARSMGYAKTVRVKVEFVVGETGEVIRTRVISRGTPPLDFNEEAEKAIAGMRFEPVRLGGIPVKVTFVKTIVFVP